MSVVGIDFGSESCYIAVARQGGIETLANDYSLRATPSCVAFTEKNRVIGVAARNQLTTNMNNTCIHFKHFIGRKFRDHRAKLEMEGLSYTVVEMRDGDLGMRVNYLQEERVFSCTEVTSMVFTKLKVLAEAALDIRINDVVIGVPSFFDDTARHCLLAAAHGAGLNVLRLFNETAATALAYGIYKQDLPTAKDKPRNVVFVDVGHSALQVFIAAFNKGKAKLLATSSDSNLGGRDFDKLLADHFATAFKKTYKVDAFTNKRAYIKLLTEVEKMKKQMSANSTQLPINIECFMNDKDVSGRMDRAAFEVMSEGLVDRVETTLTNCLIDSGLSLEDIHSVEIVGGSSRIPAIKQRIEKVFNKTPSTTLNQDEAVARGCALQCAMLSPTFKVREFSIQDVQPYSIRLVWQDEAGQEGDMEVFPKNHQVPFSKMLTFFRRGPFTLQAEYTEATTQQDRFIAAYTINEVTPNAEGESQKVKVKVRINLHGIFLVTGASLTKKEDVPIEETPPPAPPQHTNDADADVEADADTTSAPMDTDDKGGTKNGDATHGSPASADAEDSKDSAAAATEQQPDSSAATTEAGQNEQKCEADKTNVEQNSTEKKGDKKSSGPKKVTRVIELPVTGKTREFSHTQLNLLLESESKMAAGDRLENDRINAKNAVEEYVYELRSKLCEELQAYVAKDEYSGLTTELDGTEEWLYEAGEDCAKHVYVDKLAALQKRGEPIKERRRERMDLPKVFESLLASIQLARKVCDQFRANEDDRYAHLDEAEVEKVEKLMHEKQQWADGHLGVFKTTASHKPLPVTCAIIRTEKTAFDAIVIPIISKPKPKPKVEEPPPVEKTEEAAPDDEPQQNDTNEEQSKDPSDPAMDVD